MSEQADVVIVGGGVSGLGAAIGCLEQGLTAVVLERGQCGQATSASSLRIVHGGVRYLQTLDFARARRSAVAQQELLDLFPDIIKALPCLMPLNRFGLKSRLPSVIGAMLYKQFVGRVTSQKMPEVLPGRLASEQTAELPGLFSNGAFKWWDALLTSPQELVDKLKSKIEKLGGKVLEQHEVTEIELDSGGGQLLCSNGKRLTGRVVVSTLGPWISSITTNTNSVLNSQNFDWALGFNLTLNRSIVSEYAVGVKSQAGRLLFYSPRSAGESAIGTWYYKFEGNPANPQVSEVMVQEALAEFNQAFPGVELKRDQVSGVEAGVLPAKKSGSDIPNLIGSEIVKRDGAFIEVLSTKFTTFLVQGRAIAAEVKRALSA